MEHRYKLLVTDVDGTLLTPDGEVSGAVREAVRDLTARGVPVALCTGRSILASRGLIEGLGLHEMNHIFFDGAVVSMVNVVAPVYSATLKPELVEAMVGFAQEHGIDLELAGVSGSYSERETWTTHVKETIFHNPFTIGPFSGIWERESLVRAAVTLREPGDQERADHFIARFRDEVVIHSAHSPQLPEVSFLNFVAPGLSKGKAVEALARYLGIMKDEVVAVGDWLNDIPMLRAAGLAVAMGNAHEDVKAAADFVTLPAAEDGLAHVIRRFFP